MKKKGYSSKGLFGQINHYNSYGKKIGESRLGFLGESSITMKKVVKPDSAGVAFGVVLITMATMILANK